MNVKNESNPGATLPQSLLSSVDRAAVYETGHERLKLRGDFFWLAPLACSTPRSGMFLLPKTGSLGRTTSRPLDVGFANSGGLVFVDESAEEVATTWVSSRVQRCWVAAAGR